MPTYPCGRGEVAKNILMIEHCIYFKAKSSTTWSKLRIVEDPHNAGYYLLKQTAQGTEPPFADD